MLSNWHDSNENARREARLTAYALGQLDEGERTVVESELAGSETARRTVKEVCGLAGALAEAEASSPRCQPSSRLREVLEQRLDNEDQPMKTTRKDSNRSFQTDKRDSQAVQRGWLNWIVAASIVAVLVPLAWSQFRHHQRQQQPQQAADLSSPSSAAEPEERTGPATVGGQPRPVAKQPPPVGGSATPSTSMAVSQETAPAVLPPQDSGESLTVSLDPQGAPTADLHAGGAQAPVAPPKNGGQPPTQYVPHIPLGGPAGLRRHVMTNGVHPSGPLPAAQAYSAPANRGYLAPATQSNSPSPATAYPGATAPRPASAVYGQSPQPTFASAPQYGLPYAGTPIGLPTAPITPPHSGYLINVPSQPYPAVEGSGEHYAPIQENQFRSPADRRHAKSTFSIDVDTASYANVRRFLTRQSAPPANAVRVEELINYFEYDYPQPAGKEPFSVNMEVAVCPWNEAHQLVRIGLKGREIPRTQRPPCNLVFLIDVSGSMGEPDKLPLLKQALTLLVGQLNEGDRVSIVTYAGGAGLHLNAVSGDQKQRIRAAIDGLSANGGTNGSAGIEMAYGQAAETFIKEGANRVILATDGDLNLGVTDDKALLKLIREKAANDVFLTVLGFGTGNLQDSKMEMLADNGNGVYGYIDSLREARRILVRQISASLVTIAKDVKLQVEFNPSMVAGWRLIGYENRVMANRDFRDDKKDAGDVGAGHTVTALYELQPVGAADSAEGSDVGELKYQTAPVKQVAHAELTEAADSGELLTLYVRYKQPTGEESTERDYALKQGAADFDKASGDFRFASAVAAFGMLLRGSSNRGKADWPMVQQIATDSLGADSSGDRTEFLDLARRAATQPARPTLPTPAHRQIYQPSVYQPPTYQPPSSPPTGYRPTGYRPTGYPGAAPVPTPGYGEPR